MAESPTNLSYAGNASSSTLTANGSTVVIGPLTVTMAGFDLLGSHAQCQVARGLANVPSGSTDYGLADLTYTLTAAQVATGSLMTS
jgi:hypothetical protein